MNDQSPATTVRQSPGRPKLLNMRQDEDQKASEITEQFLQTLTWKLSDNLDSMLFEGQCPKTVNSFNSKFWLNCWLKTFAEARNVEAQILIGSLGENVVITIPLAIETGRFFTGIKFLAQNVSDYNYFIIHEGLKERITPQTINSIIEHIGQLLPQVDYIKLRKNCFDSFAPVNGRVRWTTDTQQVHLCELSGNWEEDIGGFIGKSSRNSLRRKMKKLAAMGEVSFAEIKTPEAKELSIRQLCEWKRKQLEELGSANIFAHGLFNAFLRSTVEEESDQMVRMFGMFVDKTPVAYLHMLCTPKCWFLYQTAYTPEEPGKYSPGYMLMLNVMEEACRKGVSIFDFGWGNESYKLRFASKSLNLHHAFLPLSLKGHAIGFSISAIERTKNFIKSNRLARTVTTFMLRVVGKLRKKLDCQSNSTN